MRSRIQRHLWPVLGERIPVRQGGPEETIAPEVPPLELSGRDYAIFLLRLAAEIEHGLMVQYLFAAYSLDSSNLAPERRPLVRGWQETILAIAKEEMAHLVTVQNLLIALGGPLQFNREDYPNDNVLYESGFTLQPLTTSSLATYVCAESPQNWDTDQARDIKREAEIAAGGTVNRVGRLYEELVRVIGDEELVPDGTFDEDGGVFQASWDAWGRGFRRSGQHRPGPEDTDAREEHELVIATVSDRATALAALNQVGEQGEGFENPAPDDDDESHFQRLLGIYEALAGMSESEQRAVIRNVATNPTTHLDGPDVGPEPAADAAGDPPAATTSPISNSEARMWAHLFNVRYRKLLVSLAHTFELAEDRSDVNRPGPRGTLINRSFSEMYNLRSIAGVLVGLPLDDADPGGRSAGPPFQMPHTLMLSHDEDDRWRLHRDLLDASGTLIGRIAAADGSGAGQDYIRALAQADRIELAQVDLLIGGAGP